MWSVVLALALALAALAARMLARATMPDASPWYRGDAHGVDQLSPVMLNRPTLATTSSSPSSCSARSMLAWLLAIGWVTFNGRRPERWPRWDVHRAGVWAAMFTSAMPSEFAPAGDD